MPFKLKKDKNSYMRRYRKTYRPPLSTVLNERKIQARYQRTEKGKSTRLTWLYGWSLEDKKRQYKKQKGLCGLCKKRLPKVSSSCTDHNHETGAIRSLLHPVCNFAVGIFENQKLSTKKIDQYLKRHRRLK